MSRGRVLIIGAGPAGLTAALELVRAGLAPLVVEADAQVGGISKTVNVDGNRMDLGGHRFFSKSDWVMKWWQDILPVEMPPGSEATLAYQNQARHFAPHRTATAADGDRVMLVRRRLSRIYYLRAFFDYPLKLNANTIGNLGLPRMARLGASYAAARMAPVRPERTLEDFLVNRFGRELYRTFFKDYTEKVWGVPCAEISAEWGAQRIKGLSITRALVHAVRQAIGGKAAAGKVETSLIEQFLYPKLGPGQLWEVVAERVLAGGGEVLLGQSAVALRHDGDRITAVDVRDEDSGAVRRVACDHVISTMPVKTLAESMRPAIAAEPLAIAASLPYRDFITAGLLVKRMTPPPGAHAASSTGMPPDNWIYVQEPDVRLGRLQIFNNWSPAMVRDHPKIFLGLEYFCQGADPPGAGSNTGDDLWNMPKERFLSFAAEELARIGLIDVGDVESGTVIKVPKAYPAYFGSYERMPELRAFFARFRNLFLVGRNGMHRYNNQDHSMVSAKMAVECILDPSRDRDAIWDVNVEQDYLEEA